MSLTRFRFRLSSVPILLLVFTVLIALLVSTRTQAQTPPATITLCVDQTPLLPGGNGDGSSWVNAMPSLDTAIAAAPVGAHIWVAEGDYRPANQATGFLITKKLRLYGGFWGDEANLQARHGSFQQTVLDGDRFGDDLTLFSYADNAVHVVSVSLVYGTLADPGVVIDGFRIANGISVTQNGGGIWSQCSDLDLANCSFDHNTATDGGGLWFVGGCYQPGDPQYQLTNIPNTLRVKTCEFFDNRADHYGGAIYGLRLNGWVMNTRFMTNRAYLQGGAVHLWRMLAQDHFDFANCAFWENYCTGPASSGGAMSLGEFSPNPGDATQADIVNCTFAGNCLEKLVFPPTCLDGQAVTVSPTSQVAIHNSIFFWNHDLEAGNCATSKPILGLPLVEYSDVEGNWTQTGAHNISSNPAFTAGSPPPTSFVLGLPPPNAVLPLLVLRKASTTARGSPCIDAADYSQLPNDLGDLDDDGITAEELPLDLLEADRAVNRHNFGEDPDTGVGSSTCGSCTFLDMGAYERSWP